MEQYVRTQVLDLYWLPDVHAAYGRWTSGPHTPAELVDAYLQVKQLLVMNKSTSWISNSTALVMPSAETKETARQWILAMTRLGIVERWANIPPQSPTSRLMIRHLRTSGEKNGLLFAQCATFEDARAWLTREANTPEKKPAKVASWR